MIDTDKDNLAELAARFRAAIIKADPATLPLVTLQNFPRGACGDAILLLAKYLQENKCGDFYYVLGEREDHSHAWLQRDSLIIDITADQFEDQKTPVIVTEDHSWHSLFNGEIQHIADFCLYDTYTVSEMIRTYSLITEHIKI